METAILDLKKTRTLSYNIKNWSFRETIEKALGETNLELLHEKKDYIKLERETDQSTHWHNLYYSNNKSFLSLYKKFIEQEIKKNYYPSEEHIVYQKIPTFRVHLKNNLSVGEFHKDRDYNHGVNELNFHLPFTDTNHHNSIWIESEEDKGDYSPQIVKYGEILIFNGVNLSHGNKLNASEHTRVSVDFRIIPYSQYTESAGESINTHVKFKIGEYFELL